MIRLSVSDLDNWRYYKDSDQALEDFLRRLRHEESPGPEMLAGRALHKILERASLGEAGGQDVETATMYGITFRFAVDCELPVLPVAELKGELEIETPSGPAMLVGVVDGFDGAVYDHKMTARFDAERYAESYQWRAYLSMFHAERFVYNVFETKEEYGEWVIWGFQRLELYAYRSMRDDVIGEVAELADFVARYLPEKVG